MSKELNQHLEQAEGAQGEREAAITKFAETCPMTAESAAGGKPYDIELRRYYLLGWDDRAALAQPSPIRCQCCGYLVTDSEHRSCLRAAQQPSPAPELEQVERFEPAHGTDRGGNVFAYMIDNEAGEYMEFAQHDRIVGALREKIDGAESQAEYQTRRAEHFAKERDAVLSRLAELEKQEPVGVMRASDEPGIAPYADIWPWLEPGTQLYAAPAAQAGQVPEGYMLITQDQVERHATTAWECPPQSRVVLVSTLKRLHEKNSAVRRPAKGE